MIGFPRSIILDATALSEFADRTAAARKWFTFTLKAKAAVYVSAVTLAEATDGSAQDARVHRQLNEARVKDTTAEIGFRAGQLRAAAGSRRKKRDLTVDAIVAATARTLPSPVLIITGDPADMKLLTAGSDVRVAPIF
jgi:predicted nucleic acid-binding protein